MAFECISKRLYSSNFVLVKSLRILMHNVMFFIEYKSHFKQSGAISSKGKQKQYTTGKMVYWLYIEEKLSHS